MYKKIFAIAVPVLFLLSVLLIAQAARPDDKPPYIEKIIFIHYEKKAKPGGGGTTSSCSYKLLSGGIRWKTFPVPYEVNPEGSGVAAENVTNAAFLSSEAWDARVTPDLFDAPALTAAQAADLDGKNTVVWSSLDPGIIAVTSLWYNTVTKTIVEFDITLSTNYGWVTDGNADKMDVQNIATHEIGHGAGLGDLYATKDAEQTMYGYSSLEETKKQTLECGDIKGVIKLYG
ncbi:MAG: matrixin family metalloprotease [Methanobacteriota archaeon]